MPKISFYGVIAFVIAACGVASAQQALAPGQMDSFLSAKLGPIIDVRVAGDCDASVRLARSAVRIPFDAYGMQGDAHDMHEQEFLARVLKIASMTRAKNSGATILVVCCAGGRSQEAAHLLHRHGFKAATLIGGVTGESFPKHLLAAVAGR